MSGQLRKAARITLVAAGPVNYPGDRAGTAVVVPLDGLGRDAVWQRIEGYPPGCRATGRGAVKAEVAGESVAGPADARLHAGVLPSAFYTIAGIAGQAVYGEFDADHVARLCDHLVSGDGEEYWVGRPTLPYILYACPSGQLLLAYWQLASCWASGVVTAAGLVGVPQPVTARAARVVRVASAGMARYFFMMA